VSLLGSIVDYFGTSDDANIVALRATVGTGFFADYLPGELNPPYCVLTSSRQKIEHLVKPGTSWTEFVQVTFAVVGTTRTQVETLIEQLEQGYLAAPLLTVGGLYTHLATYPTDDKATGIASGVNGDLWAGSLGLVYHLSRGANS
jgi:hypothetical protein